MQLEMERRRVFAEKHDLNRQDYSNDTNPFAGKLICGECGGLFGSAITSMRKRGIQECR